MSVLCFHRADQEVLGDRETSSGTDREKELCNIKTTALAKANTGTNTVPQRKTGRPKIEL